MELLRSWTYFEMKEVNSMKEGIHPNYQQTTITCACGNVIETGSTKVDTGGRVSRFNKKFGLG